MAGKIMFITEYSSVSKELAGVLEDYFSVHYCRPEGSLVHEMLSVTGDVDIIFINLADLQAYYAVASILGYRWKKNYPVVILGTREECSRFEDILRKDVLRRGRDNANYVFGQNIGEDELSLHVTYIQRPVTNSMVLERVLEVYESGRAKKPSAWGKKKILMIDDDALMMRRIKKELEPKYKVYVATSGAAGFGLIEQHQPDALLLDYEMPGYNGQQVYEIIRMNPATRNLPIFFLTGVADEERARDIIQLKPQGYILKNSGENAILKVLDEYFT